MTEILLDGIRLYGYHGCTEDEQQVGSWFEIDLAIRADVTPEALERDQIGGTIDYSKALEVVKRDFATPCHLLEHLAYKISVSLLDTFESAQKTDITIRKIAPPMPGNVRSAAVRFSLTRK